MRTVLIRHGQTQGNLEGRYIGCRTDEPLCPAGAARLRGRVYPPVKRVLSSPMLRCLQTAAILYPGMTPEIVDDFRECDFGAFEGMNYAQLNGRADYQAWIDAGGALPFPGGERREDFAERCVRAYGQLLARSDGQDCALIVHGGTIMAIMERYARPAGSYYDFQVRNGAGFVLEESGLYAPLPDGCEIPIDERSGKHYNRVDK